MEKKPRNKWTLKDSVHIITVAVLCVWGLCEWYKSDDRILLDLLSHLGLILLGYASILEIFSKMGWERALPDFMLHERSESVDALIIKALDRYTNNADKYFHDHTEETVGFVMKQLCISKDQFSGFRSQMVALRCAPLKNAADGREKIRKTALSSYVLKDLTKIDAAKRTYSHVNYFLDYVEAMHITTCRKELAASMTKIIQEELHKEFDTVVIPYDSNYLLGLEVAQKMNKPVVHMRKDRGRIEEEKCWDGPLKDDARVLIVHDVLVTSNQIVAALDKLPQSCTVVGLCCLVMRTGKKIEGAKILEEERKLNIIYGIKLSDEEIEKEFERRAMQ